MSSEYQAYCPGDPSNDRECGLPLEKHNERGVTIDVCSNPDCGTMVLGKGELARIIAEVASQPGFRAKVPHGSGHYGHSSSGHHTGYSHEKPHKKQKKEGFFEEFFEDDGGDYGSDD